MSKTNMSTVWVYGDAIITIEAETKNLRMHPQESDDSSMGSNMENWTKGLEMEHHQIEGEKMRA